MKSRLLIFVLCSCILCQAQQKPGVIPDSVQVKSHILSFYKWYNMHWNNLAAFRLYKTTKSKEVPPYTINWKEAEASFTYLRNRAPFLSKTFIELERQAFREIDSTFIQYSEDEVPAGFDYDRFTNTREDTKWFWQQLNKKTNNWAIHFSGNSAGVIVTDVEAAHGVYLFCGTLLKEMGQWLIARLSCDSIAQLKN
jgi:hypothetical protein